MYLCTGRAVHSSYIPVPRVMEIFIGIMHQVGFAGFGGTYIQRFFVAIPALTFFADRPEFAYL